MSEMNLDETAFVTFYSFKGGVGRSMALINVAGILAGRGFCVLALDLDLEAPGISYLTEQELGLSGVSRPGFVDVLTDAVERGPEADLFCLQPEQVVERYSYAYPVPEAIRTRDDGLLRIMPAGKFDGQYQARLDRLALGALYREGMGKPLIQAFKTVVRNARQFDFVLVDSRTGFSDESGICTRDLGDYLVIVMGLNRQNVEGTASFMEALRASGVTPKRMQLILSPVPNGEDDLLDERQAIASKRLSEAWRAPVPIDLSIPYHPRLALTEEPHIFRRSKGNLYEAYVEIEERLIQLLGYDVQSLSRRIRDAANAEQADAAIRGMKSLAKVDVDGSAWILLLFPLEKELEGIWLDPAQGALRRVLAESLAAVTPRGLLRSIARRFHDEELEEAQLFYEMIVTEDLEEAALLADYADFLHKVGKNNDRAEALYKRALSVDSKHVSTLGKYARFLAEIRGDRAGAQALEKQARDLDPQHAETLGNNAQRLFAAKHDAEAQACLAEALALAPTNPFVLLQLNFCAWVHAPTQYPEALGTLKGFLRRGYHHVGPSFDENVRVALEAGHPHASLLQALARVVSGGADLRTLSSFPEWQRRR